MNNSDNEVPYAEDSNSEPNQLNISDLVAHMAHFSDEDQEQWVAEMKKLGVDF